MDNTMFSVLIPAYNVEPYISECLQSISCQSYFNFEVIIVDDGSTDRTGKICDAFAQADSRFVVFHNSNHGLIYTRRFAIARAKGDYILFVDSDDYLDTCAFETINKSIEQTHCDCVIYGLRQICNGKVIYENTESENVFLCDKHSIYKKYFITDKYNNLWRKAVRRSAFDGRDYTQFYHLSMGEDILQSVEIVQNSNSIAFLSDILYNYRVNPKSITQTVKFQKYTVDFTVRQYVYNQVKKDNILTNEEWKEFCLMCLMRICDEVSKISSFNTTERNKKRLYQEIKSTEYYRAVIDNSEKRKLSTRYFLIYTLFKLNFYPLISAMRKTMQVWRTNDGKQDAKSEV